MVLKLCHLYSVIFNWYLQCILGKCTCRHLFRRLSVTGSELSLYFMSWPHSELSTLDDFYIIHLDFYIKHATANCTVFFVNMPLLAWTEAEVSIVRDNFNLHRASGQALSYITETSLAIIILMLKNLLVKWLELSVSLRTKLMWSGNPKIRGETPPLKNAATNLSAGCCSVNRIWAHFPLRTRF